MQCLHVQEATGAKLWLPGRAQLSQANLSMGTAIRVVLKHGAIGSTLPVAAAQFLSPSMLSVSTSGFDSSLFCKKKQNVINEYFSAPGLCSWSRESHQCTYNVS
jgi:hypothetical protein